MRPERQREVLRAWEIAVDKTGGYFYSRLLLGTIAGVTIWIFLVIIDVPFALPLALWMGFFSTFVPIVGTYIGSAVPILVALLDEPWKGIAILIYILVYQQIENYILSPRITAKTMSLHPAVAFAAALIGGALGGLFMAFLALPVAGVIQASVGEWSKSYEVVRDDVTTQGAAPKRPGLVERLRGSRDTTGDGD
jgi:predicted PurR-regulated permease PerM